MTDWEGAGVRVLVGDCRERLRELPDASVDAVVTDAPYELGFMDRNWDRRGVAFDPATWAAVLRVAKPGAYLLSFGGTRTYHRMTCAVEDAGWEIRDMIEWIYGTGWPKNAKVALKPAHEPICMARKPFRGSVAANVLEHGTGGLNIDGARIHTAGSEARAYTVTRLKPGATLNATGGNWRPEDGGVEYQGATKAGRWPANLVLSHSPGCVPVGTRRVASNGHVPAQTGRRSTYMAGLDGHEAGERYMGGLDGTEAVEAWECVEGCPVAELDRQSGERVVGQGGTNHTALGLMNDDGWQARDMPRKFYGDTGGASRFFPTFRYVAKASASERSAGLPHGQRNTHPTVKPIELMRWLLRLVTPPAGTVLDPFMGSGTTGCAAALEGLGFIGIDDDSQPGSVVTAIARIRHWTAGAAGGAGAARGACVVTTLLVAGSSRCAASCYEATGPECTCPCGGVNHGVGLVRALAQAPELVDSAARPLVAVLELPLRLVVVEAEPAPAAEPPAAAIERAGPEERRVAPGPLQVAEERPAPHADGPPATSPQPAHEEEAPMPAKVDLRAPYTSEEWAAITAALKAERERRTKRGAPFTQAEQVAVINEAVRPMRTAALNAEAR